MPDIGPVHKRRNSSQVGSPLGDEEDSQVLNQFIIAVTKELIFKQVVRSHQWGGAYLRLYYPHKNRPMTVKHARVNYHKGPEDLGPDRALFYDLMKYGMKLLMYV